MGMSERLAFLLDLRADQAIRSMEDVGRTAEKQLGKAEDRTAKLGATFTKVGAGMVATGGILAAGLFSAARATSDLNESVNVSELTFGAASDQIEAFASTAANELGLSKRAALDAAAGFGGLLQNMGITRGESIKLSKDLTTLSADMASAFNTSSEDAVLAIGSALRGESEPIRRFNVFLSDTAVKARAVELGLAASANEVTNSALVQARLSLIMEQTNRIQGDFANTADGAANAQRRLAAQTENFKAGLGEAALPVMESGLGLLNGLLGAFNAMPPAVQGAVSQVAMLSTGLLLTGGAAATVTGKALSMLASFKGMRAAANDGESWIGTLRGVTGGAVKAGAAFGLTTVAIGMYADMMGKATQRGRDFAAQVEQDSLSNITSYDELARKLDALREGADELRSSQSGGPIGSIIDADYNRELQSGAEGLENLVTKYDKVREQAENLATATGISNDSAVQFISTQAALGIEFDNTADAVAEWQRTIDGGTESVNAQVTSVDDLKSAIKGYFDELHATKNAQIAFEEAVDDTIEGLKESGINYDASSEAGRKNQQAVMKLQTTLGDLYAETLRNTGSAEEARTATLEYAMSLEQQARDAGLSAHVVSDLIAKLDLAGTYDRLETEFNMRGLDYARAETQGLAWDLNNIPREITVQLYTEYSDMVVDAFRRSSPSSRNLALDAGGFNGAATTSGNTIVNVTVHAGLGTDGHAVGEQIAVVLTDFQRSGGTVPWSAS